MFLPGGVEKGGSASAPRPAATDLRFPRSCRLTARKQFNAVYRRGRRVKTSSFSLFGLPNTAGQCRLGVTVTRKVGGAVTRNRVKRMIREVFRLNRARLEPELDLVVNAHPGIENRTVNELERDFLRGFAALASRFDKP